MSQLPTPDQLAQHPELACLHALQALLAVAERSMLAEHPVLQQGDDYLEEAGNLTADMCFAEVILQSITGLEFAISRYRKLLDRLEHRRIIRLGANDF